MEILIISLIIITIRFLVDWYNYINTKIETEDVEWYNIIFSIIWFLSFCFIIIYCITSGIYLSDVNKRNNYQDTVNTKFEQRIDTVYIKKK